MNAAYLTITDAARRVNRDTDTIYRWINEGPEEERLKIVWFYGKRYVEVSQLLEVYRRKLKAPKGGKGKPRLPRA